MSQTSQFLDSLPSWFGYWFAGLVDAEGCFYMQIAKTKVTCGFRIDMREDDLPVLEMINDVMGCGSINSSAATKKRTGMKAWRVSRNTDIINKIIPLFDKYPLVTKKKLGYYIWKEAAALKQATFGKVRTEKQLNALGKLHAELKNSYSYMSDIYEAVCEYGFMGWFSGFADGEGSFAFAANKRLQPRYSFSIGLRDDDKPILSEIARRLQVGKLYRQSNQSYRNRGINAKDGTVFKVSSFKELMDVVIPLFDSYPLRTRKKAVYDIWREAMMFTRGVHGRKRSRDEIERILQYQRETQEIKHMVVGQ